MEHLRLRADGTMIARLPIRGQRKDLIICPKTKRKEVTQNKYQMVHLGVTKTTARVLLDWYWPEMTADIRRFVLGCLIYRQSKVAKSKTASERQYLCRATLAAGLSRPVRPLPRN